MKKLLLFSTLIIVFLYFAITGWMLSRLIPAHNSWLATTLAEDVALILKKAKKSNSIKYEDVKLNYFEQAVDFVGDAIAKKYEPIMNPTLKTLKDDGKGFTLRNPDGSSKVYLRLIHNQQALTIESASAPFCVGALTLYLEYDSYDIEVEVNDRTLTIPFHKDYAKASRVVEDNKKLSNQDIERLCEQHPLVINFYYHPE